jgi:hypothetical protein
MSGSGISSGPSASAAEVYTALRRELADRKLSTGLGDEGGFAAEINEPEKVLRLLLQAIRDAGYEPGPQGCRSPWTWRLRSSGSPTGATGSRTKS